MNPVTIETVREKAREVNAFEKVKSSLPKTFPAEALPVLNRTIEQNIIRIHVEVAEIATAASGNNEVLKTQYLDFFLSLIRK